MTMSATVIISGMSEAAKKRRVLVLAVGIIFTVCLALFVVGIVFITDRQRTCDSSRNASTTSGLTTEDQCKHSEEAKNSGFINFLKKMQRTYCELHPKPNGLSSCPARTDWYRPTMNYVLPVSIKNFTDSARNLVTELKGLDIDVAELKPREQKALADVKHALIHSFGEPYSWDYYSGDWMLGPNSFCNHYVCYIAVYVLAEVGSYNVRPRNLQDIRRIRDVLGKYNETIHQYLKNMRAGISRGMVRSVEECLAGIDAIKSKYLKIAGMNASGILQEWFVQLMVRPLYLEHLNGTDVEAEWYAATGQSVNESIRDFLVEYLGKPLHELIRFLEHEHIHYCVPSNISSGLATLPLDYVYYNGTKTKTKTVTSLPTGERLDGKKIYQKILSYYATTNITAEEVHKLGWKQAHIIYPQMVDIAKNVTGEMNESVAVEAFKLRLNNRSQFFNSESFPDNESNTEAYTRCRTSEDAQRFCPKRWAALQLWFAEAGKVMSQLDPETCRLFYFAGSKRSTPNCPVEMQANFNPSTGAQSYHRSNSQCSFPAKYKVPFFIDNYGPRYQEMTVNAHEARPGHHTQIQGYLENFKKSCPDSNEPLNLLNYNYGVFSEGWALYAENPLVGQDTDIYSNRLMATFGMLKSQMLRALRLIVDTGLHYTGMTRHEAIEMFARYAWDTSDVIAKEVTRYQSNPGQATTYMIGQIFLLNLRNYTKTHLVEQFDLKDFHYQVLRHGQVPLSFIDDQIKQYVKCKKDKNSTDCRRLTEGSTSWAMQQDDADEDVLLNEEKILYISDLLQDDVYY